MIYMGIRPSFLGILVCCLWSSATALAGNDTGNGGNSVVCFDASGRIRSAELLDLYEARVMRGILPDLGASTLPYKQKVEIAINRMERLSPVRSAKYRAWISEFERDSLFLPGVTLVEVPDSDHVAVPSGCRRIQLIVQRKPAFPEDKRFTVSKDIWGFLDNDNRAAAILHETIYREGFEENFHKSSVASRYFNSIVVSNRLISMTLEDFAKLLMSLPMTDIGLPGYGLGGSLTPVVGYFIGAADPVGYPLGPQFRSVPPTYYPDGNAIRTAWLSDTRPQGAKQIDLGNKYWLDSRGGGEITQAGLFADGTLKELHLRYQDTIYSYGSASDSTVREATNSLITFDSQGNLVSIRAKDDPEENYPEEGHVRLKSGRNATLWDDPSGDNGTLYFNLDGTYARSSGKVDWY